ncbi:hypothetical protein KXR64_14275 [Brucella intermedia]|uniref:hypothetical protein n=1 Tax=Brucella TaxID=234 RepID=UPI0009463710|nr:hypothetical protein [Brucella intermedia]
MRMSREEAQKLADSIQQREELIKLRDLLGPGDRAVEVGKCRVRLHAAPLEDQIEWDSMELPRFIMDRLLEDGVLGEYVDKMIADIEENLSIDGIHIDGMPVDPEDVP